MVMAGFVLRGRSELKISLIQFLALASFVNEADAVWGLRREMMCCDVKLKSNESYLNSSELDIIYIHRLSGKLYGMRRNRFSRVSPVLSPLTYIRSDVINIG